MPTVDLAASLHAPRGGGDLLERVYETLQFHFLPREEEERALFVRKFWEALSHLPAWAATEALDEWDRIGKGRPTPAHIIELAQRRLKIVTDELAHRRKEEAMRNEPEPAGRSFEEKAEAERVLRRVGFTPQRFAAVAARPMASTVDELVGEDEVQAKPHWSELVAPDSPDMEALRRARLANPTMRQAMGLPAEPEAS